MWSVKAIHWLSPERRANETMAVNWMLKPGSVVFQTEGCWLLLARAGVHCVHGVDGGCAGGGVAPHTHQGHHHGLGRMQEAVEFVGDMGACLSPVDGGRSYA